jgi:hypothetical protein
MVTASFHPVDFHLFMTLCLPTSVFEVAVSASPPVEPGVEQLRANAICYHVSRTCFPLHPQYFGFEDVPPPLVAPECGFLVLLVAAIP